MIKKEQGTMWVLYAFGSALFAGLTAVLAKCGIRKTDSTVATAIRTIVVLVFSWLMVFLVGSQSQITQLGRTYGHQQEELAVSDPLGPGYRRELALLLPRAADRRYQQGRTGRQVQHGADDPAGGRLPA